ncbi:MAG: hypothetical protein AB7P52_07120 [Alphaproteobacteria bacterium]
MASPSALDRMMLGPAGLALSEDEYAQAVAGMGAGWLDREAPSTPPGGLPHQFLSWSADRFRIARGPDPLPGPLATYRDVWFNERAKSPDGRLLVEAASFDAQAPELFGVVRILSHPACQLDAVVVDLEAPAADLKWQWPLRIRAFEEDHAALGLDALRGLWPAGTLSEPRAVSRADARAEVLVMRASVREALRRLLGLPYRVRAGFILLLAPVDLEWRELHAHVDALLAETQAAGLSLVSLPPDAPVPEALNHWIGALSHNLPFDLALTGSTPRDSSVHIVDRRLVDNAALPEAARRLGRRLRRLPEDAPLALPKASLERIDMAPLGAEPPAAIGEALESRAGDLPFHAESTGGAAISEISAAEREARRAAAREEPARYLQGDVYWMKDGTPLLEPRGLGVGQPYLLDLHIGAPGEALATADAPFPAEQLDWERAEAYKLQVLFAEPNQWDEPLRGTLELPRSGASSKCRFAFAPTRAGPFAGRVTILYRGRILQTALLETAVLASVAELDAPRDAPPLRLRVEAQIRHRLSTLDDRRRFDACLVLNHTADHRSAMTGAGKDGAFITTLDGIKPQLASINGLLNQVALDTKSYAKGLGAPKNAELLVSLAKEGNVLHRRLVTDYIQRSSAAEEIRGGEYLQIVSAQPDALLPLEFVYEFKPPKTGAPVCKNAKQALKDGSCPASCVPSESPAPHVCPLGFWGLSKVIERHVHDPALGEGAKVLSEPELGRDVLTLKGAGLLAASEQVPKADRASLAKGVGKAWGKVTTANSWADWKKGVQAAKPVLLVALPHAGGSGAEISLEIGGDVLESLYIDQDYVRPDPERPPPVAILLGCDTANVAYTDAYARHVAVFRQADAALVLGTVATVLGADAAKMAARLVAHLSKAVRGKPGRFGEVLREAKRLAVADSLMIALCLVAFGDADWQIEA